MNLTQLRVFATVADLRHFARAAAACNLSQPAVSHQIAQLEQEFGAKLFNRTPRRVSLTVAGEVLLEEARHVLAAADRARQRMEEVARGALGRIRLGATSTPGIYWLPPLLARYSAAHPAFELQFQLGHLHDLAERVIRNDLDMAIVASPPAGAELRTRRLCADRLQAVAGPSSPFVTSRVRRDDLRTVPWILREEGSETRHAMLAWLQQQRVTPAHVQTFEGCEAVKSAAVAGLGVAVLSRRAVEDDIERGRLAEVRVEPALPSRQFFVIDHPLKHHGAACRAMLALLNDATA